MRKILDLLLKHKVMGHRHELPGVYRFPHPTLKDHIIHTIASDGMGWEHVSVTIWPSNDAMKSLDRTPTWEEMCYVKDLFWNDNETVIQFHPAKQDYVNKHNFCLHLWRPVGVGLPLPLKEMIG